MVFRTMKSIVQKAFAFMLPVTLIPIGETIALTASTADFKVYLNEVCSQNKSCFSDSYGVYSDWIELYNAGNVAVDLSGYGLSDDVNTPLQWVFPAGTTLAPHQYMIVFASKQASTAQEFHTGFALSKNGEVLLLSDPNGTVIQQLTIPTLGEDSAYGRTPDGGDTFEIMEPTPGLANQLVVSAPFFSADSGFYDTDFSLSLSSAGNETIYYTIDGSDPTTSPNAQIYTWPITVTDRTNEANLYSAYAEDDDSPQSICRGIGYQAPTFSVDKATVVRAAAKDENGIFSDVISRTYFITSGNLEQYADLTVVSLVTNPDNLFDSDTGIYVTGQQYIDWKNSDAYDPNKSVWDSDNITNYFSRGREWEREATVTIWEDGKTVVEQNMGIRIKGASTRNGAQKSFNLYARSEYGASKIEYPLIADNYDINGNLIDRYDSVSLRSVSDEVRLRDGFAQKLIADRENITTQDMTCCAVFLNGEYWGMYEITKKLSDYFIESNYAIEKENVAMIKNGELEEGAVSELDSFLAFIDQYSKLDLSDQANYQAVCDYIDIDSFIEHYAAGLYLGTYDWPNYNYAVWRNTGAAIGGNPYSDGKWRFISYDFDYTMGATYDSFGGVEGYAYDSFAHMDGKKADSPTSLFVQLLKNEEFRNQFAAVYCDYANEVLTLENANTMTEIYKSDYTDQLANTTVRWWGYFGGAKESNLAYHKNLYQNTTLQNIRTFFEQRAGYTLEDMKAYLNLSGSLQTITLQTNGNGRIRINSIVPETVDGAWSGQYYSDCPVTLTAIPADGEKFEGWSGDISGNDTTVVLTLSQALSVQANFTQTDMVQGDVNADGQFTIADVVLMQKYLLNMDSLNAPLAGDMLADGTLNALDFSLMKRAFYPTTL